MRILFFIVFTGFGLVMISVGGQQYLQQRRLLDNPREVDALMVRSEVVPITSRESDSNRTRTLYRPEVRFEYWLDGRKHQSEFIRPTIIGGDFSDRAEAAAEIKAFPQGATVKAFVNPALPDRGYLVKEKSDGPLVFVIVGLFVPVANWALWRFMGRKKKSGIAGAPFPSRA